MNSNLQIIYFAIIVAIIGTPLSYLAMRIERKDISLPTISWVRIFITFMLTGILAKMIEMKYRN